MKSGKSKIFSLISLLALLSLFMEASAWTTKPQTTGKLNINIATQKEFQLLPGIGKSKALDILKLRTQIKGFKRLDDLLKVKGLGKKLFAKIEPYIKLDGNSDFSSPTNPTNQKNK